MAPKLNGDGYREHLQDVFADRGASHRFEDSLAESAHRAKPCVNTVGNAVPRQNVRPSKGEDRHGRNKIITGESNKSDVNSPPKYNKDMGDYYRGGGEGRGSGERRGGGRPPKRRYRGSSVKNPDVWRNGY